VEPDELLLELLADGGQYEPDEFRDEPTVRGKFVRDVGEAPLPPDEREQIRRIGLSALAGRSDIWPATQTRDSWE
jgi:hypothetical protein